MVVQSVQGSLRIHGTRRMSIALIGLAVWLNGGQVSAIPILFPGGGVFSEVMDNSNLDSDPAVGVIRVIAITIPGTNAGFSGQASITKGIDFLKFTITGATGGPPAKITSSSLAEALQGGAGILFIQDNYAFSGRGSLRTSFEGTLEAVAGNLAGGPIFSTDANASTFTATDGFPGNDAFAVWNGPGGPHAGPDQVSPNSPADSPVRTGRYALGGGIAKGFIKFKMGGGFEQFKFPDSAEFEFQAVPEPSTLTLLGIGTLGLLAYSWRGLRSRRRS